MTIADRLASTPTRAHALELLLVAHAILDRQLLAGRRAPRVSAACTLVLASIADTPVGAPVTAEGVYVDGWELPDTLRVEAANLAADALQLTTEDLAFLSRDLVLELVGATPVRRQRRQTATDRLLEMAAAGTTAGGAAA